VSEGYVVILVTENRACTHSNTQRVPGYKNTWKSEH